ncbi:MAG: ABC transporter permease [Myxococcota bacterium]
MSDRQPTSPRRPSLPAETGPLAALIAVYLLFVFISPDNFGRLLILETMIRQTVVVSILAVGMTLVIIKGGIDLSVGSVVALTTVVCARVSQTDPGLGPVVLAGLAVGLAAGLLNGILVAWLRITPFIVTLATMSILRGAAKGIADQKMIDAHAYGLDAWMSALPEESYALFPPGVWLAAVVAVGVGLLLHFTPLGRHIVAIGSNALTARLCGVSVERVTAITYALMGLLGGLAGLMEFATLTVGDPTDSVGLELDVIAAVVIGGGSLAGGRGSVAGAVFGALLMTVIKTGCNNIGLDNWVQEILTGVIILIAVGLDRFRAPPN